MVRVISARDMNKKERTLGLLEQIKIAANRRDVPYQSLIKMWLAEKVE
jgi:predicted DNA binding CopG/RHH family protein